MNSVPRRIGINSVLRGVDSKRPKAYDHRFALKWGAETSGKIDVILPRACCNNVAVCEGTSAWLVQLVR